MCHNLNKHLIIIFAGLWIGLISRVGAQVECQPCKEMNDWCDLKIEATNGWNCAGKDPKALLPSTGRPDVALSKCLPKEYKVANITKFCCTWSQTIGCQIIKSKKYFLQNDVWDGVCWDCGHICPCNDPPSSKSLKRNISYALVLVLYTIQKLFKPQY